MDTYNTCTRPLKYVTSINTTRLDPPIIAFQLKHGECKVLITDTEHSETVEAALEILDKEGVKRCAFFGLCVYICVY